MNKLNIGLVAHVDSGKTTLNESMLYLTGSIKKQGRVDHKDTFLDYDKQERDRGITIFSKMSHVVYKDIEFTFIDTPGHIDFSGEMERALSILDCAIFIVSSLDGMISHSKTIFSLLQKYNIPTFIFVNKMDISHLSKEDILNNMQNISSFIVDLEDKESVAMCDDILLEEYSNGNISNQSLKNAINNQKVIPVVFGSALKNEGVIELLDLISLYASSKEIENSVVYKVTYENNERLVFIRVGHKTINVKDEINDEKIHQIRKYNGNKYELLNSASCNDIIALTGIKNLNAGDIIGNDEKIVPYLKPHMNYTLHIDKHDTKLMNQIMLLGEEEPLLNLKVKEGHVFEVSLMGDVQIEILKNIIKDRFNEDVIIDNREVSYKETIINEVEGVGHYEPLRHYSEVHVLLEPLDRGSGIVFENKCQNNLPEHYQRLIMSHLKEKIHLGVLTASPITDIKITLLGGLHHDKHTVGGDFREASYRAVRNALLKTESILLEPYESYEIQIPSQYLSKIFYDFEDYDTPSIVSDNGEIVLLKGKAPSSFLYNYNQSLLSFTKGEGHLALGDVSYDKCLNEEEVIKKKNYDPFNDLENVGGSVFCKKGAGFYVPYDEVENYMHLDYLTKVKEKETITLNNNISDDEVKRVYESIYGKQEVKLAIHFYGSEKKVETHLMKSKKECLLVDGYNVIYSSKELTEKANENLGAARDTLIDMLSSYQGFKGCELIVVFDAYNVKTPLTKEKYHNIYIVYTKEAQTADSYIEAATKELASKFIVKVATSDNLEQKIVLGHGALRISSRELLSEMEYLSKNEQNEFRRKNPVLHNTLMEDLKK